jgi:hypothetical protein
VSRGKHHAGADHDGEPLPEAVLDEAVRVWSPTGSSQPNRP